LKFRGYIGNNSRWENINENEIIKYNCPALMETLFVRVKSGKKRPRNIIESSDDDEEESYDVPSPFLADNTSFD
jgi:hypothetical protein